MDIIGVIFDFNGTMIFDRQYHLDAWRDCVEDVTMREMSRGDVLKHIDGKGPREILEHFLGEGLSDAMIQQFSEEKERIYRSMLLKNRLPLAPGLEVFLDYLSNARIPMAIASSATPENMNLYYDEYELFRWFDQDHILSPSADTPAKPHPALYEKAVQALKLPARYCVAFEDSAVGIEAAYAAGIRNIIHVSTDMPGSFDETPPGVIRTIRDYTELKEL